MLEPGYESFVGQYPIPMRHGMTAAELAQFFNAEFGLDAELESVPMAGWSREMYFDETDVPWIMPSPNMPTLDTAIVYPGTVLFEGTQLSEGRGTTRPFELIGAPWLDGEALAARMNDVGLAGVYFRPAIFEPTFQKHARTTCGGCQMHVLTARRFRPGHSRRGIVARMPTHSRPTSSNGATRLTNTSTIKCRSTSSQARPRCGSRSSRKSPCATSPTAGALEKPPSTSGAGLICSTD